MKKENEKHSIYTSRGKLKASPADSIKTIDEINLIKNYFLDRKEYRNYALFILGISTAYRAGDILRLKFKNLFDENGNWRKEIVLIEEKTGKRRSMEITETIKNAVNLYIENEGGCYFDDYIFKSRKGGNSPLSVPSACKIFKEMAKNLNLNYHCSTHFLRKTFAYWFLQIHKNDATALATLQEILNHSSSQITLKYCGLAKEKQQNMARKVSELW
ncbi:MAG: tyrosine-type recombinase/integrase [Oscillospiraceae bacterium]|jgi:integrase|nr:tyrosine-type recombinase/integrase [Oscillospiraceae bacterium]